MATIEANPKFNDESAATELRNAMRGLGTDEVAIIKILVAHNNAQRIQIKAKYKSLFGRELVADLVSELGGKLEDAVMALMQPLPQFLAGQLRSSMQGAGTDESTLIEILCPRPNNEIASIKAHYETMFQRKLEEDLKSETSNNFESLLVSMCSASRDESTNVDKGKAETDAKALIEAGIKQVGTDESEFNRILCTRSFAQLRATFEKYKEIVGVGILDTINSEMSGTLAEGFSTIVEYIWDSAEFFAKRLHKAMDGAGTDDRTLIRLIVSRCEFDLKNISRSFQKKYKRPLGEAIKSDCSGDYCRLLLAILGNN